MLLRVSKTWFLNWESIYVGEIDKTKITHSLGIYIFSFKANVLKSMIPTVLSLLVEMKIELKMCNSQRSKIIIPYVYMLKLRIDIISILVHGLLILGSVINIKNQCPWYLKENSTTLVWQGVKQSTTLKMKSNYFRHLWIFLCLSLYSSSYSLSLHIFLFPFKNIFVYWKERRGIAF